jgi:kumamolisin
VTAVGGTRVSVNTDGTWHSETVWEQPLANMGAGGGLSALYPLPAWQQDSSIVNPQVNPRRMRQVPDVSADADPASGAAVYLGAPGGRGWSSGGGTSQSAPIWAGMMALINEYLKQRGLGAIGFVNPALYRIAKTGPLPAFHDITTGYNLLYPATTGHDLATGLGTPDAWNLAQDLEAYLRSGGR